MHWPAKTTPDPDVSMSPNFRYLRRFAWRPTRIGRRVLWLTWYWEPQMRENGQWRWCGALQAYRGDE